MAAKALPCPTLLRQLLRYEPETGKLFWQHRPIGMFADTAGKSAANAQGIWNARFADTEAFGTLSTKGYLRGSIRGRTYVAHRVVWALVYDDQPNGFIDHIDHDRKNNRIVNLRVVETCTENGRNMSRSKMNTSGHTGVSWSHAAQKWEAYIMVDRRKRYLGLFSNNKDAAAARVAANKVFGFHENHGGRF